MGWRLLRLLGSAPGFLSIGVTAAVLRGEGTIPVVREEWIMCVMRGAKEGTVALTRAVGRGSNWQVDDLDFLIRPVVSKTEGRANTESDWEGDTGGNREEEL